MPDPVMKYFSGFEIKDAAKGEVEAVIATLGVVDRDEDIIRHDAIRDGAKVRMSSWGHEAMYGARPVGKGTLHVERDQLRFKGRIFLNTVDGRETFEVLKELGGETEWSFGFKIIGSETPSDDERAKGARRALTKLDAFEVSPVMIGAGVGTMTVGLKSAASARDPRHPVGHRVRVLANHMPGMAGMLGTVTIARAGDPPYYAVTLDEPMHGEKLHKWLAEDEIEDAPAAEPQGDGDMGRGDMMDMEKWAKAEEERVEAEAKSAADAETDARIQEELQEIYEKFQRNMRRVA